MILDTPYLALDLTRMDHNVARLARRMRDLGVTLRPHVKTAKSVDAVRRMFGGGTGPITASTLREAEVFADAGFTDMIYAVGIAPQKLARVVALRGRGVDVAVILDSVEQAEAVARASRESGDRIPALVELDCDGHRSGLRGDDPRIIDIARTLEDGGAELRGVVLHAGESYQCFTPDALEAAAERERATAAGAAEMLRAAGFACPVVSVGSTPTAHFARDLTGVTEVRAGVYMFQDLVMAGLGVCTLDDIATAVVATVIGHQKGKGWIITDAGWMAMSRDRGTASQPVDQGYGIVTSMDDVPYDDLIMSATSQEHGILTVRRGSDAPLPDLPVGTQVKIYPNHACATAAQFDEYVVMDGGEMRGTWARFRGW